MWYGMTSIVMVLYHILSSNEKKNHCIYEDKPTELNVMWNIWASWNSFAKASCHGSKSSLGLLKIFSGSLSQSQVVYQHLSFLTNSFPLVVNKLSVIFPSINLLRNQLCGYVNEWPKDIDALIEWLNTLGSVSSATLLQYGVIIRFSDWWKMRRALAQTCRFHCPAYEWRNETETWVDTKIWSCACFWNADFIYFLFGLFICSRSSLKLHPNASSGRKHMQPLCTVVILLAVTSWQLQAWGSHVWRCICEPVCVFEKCMCVNVCVCVYMYAYGWEHGSDVIDETWKRVEEDFQSISPVNKHLCCGLKAESCLN